MVKLRSMKINADKSGVDSTSASDFVLIGEYNSKEDLETYKSHPEHMKVLDLISSLKGRTAVVDFEF